MAMLMGAYWFCSQFRAPHNKTETSKPTFDVQTEFELIVQTVSLDQ
jgi:hypothetical protein